MVRFSDVVINGSGFESELILANPTLIGLLMECLFSDGVAQKWSAQYAP